MNEALPTHLKFASRSVEFCLERYASDITVDDFVVFVMDVSAACDLEEAYPVTVTAVVGSNITAHRVLQVGIGRRDDISEARDDLRQILTGCDPRPLLILKVRGRNSTDELKKAIEDPFFEEFADYRIGQDGRPAVPGPRNGTYTEMVVSDADVKEHMLRRLVSLVDQHHIRMQRKLEHDLEVSTAETRLVADLKMKLQVSDANMLVKTAEIEHLREKCEALKDKCEKMGQTLTQVMPRKYSVFKNMF